MTGFVSARARELYSCNSRMEKALESVARSQSNVEASNQPQNVDVKVVNALSTAPSNLPTSPLKNLRLSAALKGVSKALLERVNYFSFIFSVI